jgi:hypothetical protein
LRGAAPGGLPGGTPLGASSEPPRSGRPRAAVAPSHRPPWLVVLSSLILLYGGLLLLTGLTMVRDPMAPARVQPPHVFKSADETFDKQLMAANARAVGAHRQGVRVLAAGSVALALIMLYAAAAALSRDRRGRTIVLAAAWLGIGYQLAGLPVHLPISVEYARAATPLFLQRMEAEKPPGAPSTPPETAAGIAHASAIAVPVMTSLLGMAGSAILIAFFGGRRGRVLYGLEAPRPARPGRGKR